MEHVNAQDYSYHEYVHSNLSQYVWETHFCLLGTLFLLIHDSKVPSCSIHKRPGPRCQISALPLSFIHTYTESEPPSSAMISAPNFTFVSSWSYQSENGTRSRKNARTYFENHFFMLRAIRLKAEEIFENAILAFWVFSSVRKWNTKTKHERSVSKSPWCKWSWTREVHNLWSHCRMFSAQHFARIRLKLYQAHQSN